MKPFYWIYKKKLWRQIKNKELPEHIGIILDGNRRFAKERDLPPWYGHEAGAEAVEHILKYCFKLGIKILTLYAFSTENFNRAEKEVQKIMEIAKRKFKEIMEHPMIHKYKVKIKAIGRLYKLPEDLQKVIQEAEETTKNYKDFQINVAISYGGRKEIVDCMKRIGQKIKDKELQIEEINEETIERNLYTKGLPDPELIIRTSGEERLSGFLLWQSAYSELIFLELYWPAIRKIDLWRAIRVFQQRNRRFGK
ncbi:MAG: di-trans,poly-cis-decaprenylcistransferase [Promethearchaeota archaeon]|nr:MAG: di-trans,poly-cis-decaprenylcistransferase [Candidatus Lokiarchaeota archaeon]